MINKNDNEVYIIAEIGQNHNGDINICKKLIDQLVVFSYDEITGERLNTVNAIKLTKRDLDEELSDAGMKSLYGGKNSFGKTYGEHRDFLELTYDEHCEISDYVRSKGIDFIDTLCSPKTVKLTEMTTIDKIKIASRDLTNIPLLREISKTGTDVIISTGMAGRQEIDYALNLLEECCLTDYERNITILHCLSQYPAEYSKLNLLSIKKLEELYGHKHTIGYSDHSIGTHIPLAAVAMGARVIEKHVTLDRNMKGTDHKGSSEPQEMKQLVHDIRTLEKSFGTTSIYKDTAVESASKKLERSLAVSVDMNKGDVFTFDNIHMISPGDGLKWGSVQKFIGKKINKNIIKNTLLDLNDIQ